MAAAAAAAVDDLEHIPAEEVFEQLKCSKEGLSSEDRASRLQISGPNKFKKKLKVIFTTEIVLGSYLALMTVIFFLAMKDTDFFSDKFGVRSLRDNEEKMMVALCLQVSVVSQALIFVTRSRSWFFMERPGLLLISTFLIAQLTETLLAVYPHWAFARIQGIGWGWAGVIWIYNIVLFFPLDLFKFAIGYALSGKAGDNLLQNKTAFKTKKDY